MAKGQLKSGVIDALKSKYTNQNPSGGPGTKITRRTRRKVEGMKSSYEAKNTSGYGARKAKSRRKGRLLRRAAKRSLGDNAQAALKNWLNK